MESLKNQLKKLISNQFAKLGYTIRRKHSTINDTFLLEQIQSNNVDLIVDVGANIGQFASNIISYNDQIEIWSFEPSSIAYRQLLKNSRSYPNWKIQDQMALGAHNENIKINISDNIVSSSILKIEKKHIDNAPSSVIKTTENIQMKTLDSFELYGSNRNIFLKIDTQGYELEVLKGAIKTFSNISLIKLELSTYCLYKDQPLCDELISFLYKKNFNIIDIENGFRSNSSSEMLQFDALFKKENLTLHA